MSTEAKVQKLREFIEPVKAQWQNENIRSSLKSYASFCELLGLDKAQRYLANRRAHEIRDWGSQELDAEGLAVQAELEERLKVRNVLVLNVNCQILTHAAATPSVHQVISGIFCRETGQDIRSVSSFLCAVAGWLLKHPCRSPGIPQVCG